MPNTQAPRALIAVNDDTSVDASTVKYIKVTKKTDGPSFLNMTCLVGNEAFSYTIEFPSADNAVAAKNRITLAQQLAAREDSLYAQYVDQFNNLWQGLSEEDRESPLGRRIKFLRDQIPNFRGE